MQRLLVWQDPDQVTAGGNVRGIQAAERLESVRHAAFANGVLGGGYPSRTARPGLDAPESYTDHAVSVFLLGQVGLPGAFVLFVALLSLPLMVARVPGEVVSDSDRVAADFTMMTLTLAPAVVALYLLAGNTGFLPLTGKNVYFLGLNSRSDLVAGLLLWAAMIWTHATSRSASPRH